MTIKQMENAGINHTNILSQLAEDPFRQPHEKESAWHLTGDGMYVDVTSFKRVICKGYIENPHFNLKWLHMLDADSHETTVDSYKTAAEHPEWKIIGVTGRIPVGSLSVSSSPRNSNSHAKVVK